VHTLRAIGQLWRTRSHQKHTHMSHIPPPLLCDDHQDNCNLNKEQYYSPQFLFSEHIEHDRMSAPIEVEHSIDTGDTICTICSQQDARRCSASDYATQISPMKYMNLPSNAHPRPARTDSPQGPTHTPDFILTDVPTLPASFPMLTQLQYLIGTQSGVTLCLDTTTTARQLSETLPSQCVHLIVTSGQRAAIVCLAHPGLHILSWLLLPQIWGQFSSHLRGVTGHGTQLSSAVTTITAHTSLTRTGVQNLLNNTLTGVTKVDLTTCIKDTHDGFGIEFNDPSLALLFYVNNHLDHNLLFAAPLATLGQGDTTIPFDNNTPHSRPDHPTHILTWSSHSSDIHPILTTTDTPSRLHAYTRMVAYHTAYRHADLLIWKFIDDRRLELLHPQNFPCCCGANVNTSSYASFCAHFTTPNGQHELHTLATMQAGDILFGLSPQSTDTEYNWAHDDRTNTVPKYTLPEQEFIHYYSSLSLGDKRAHRIQATPLHQIINALGTRPTTRADRSSHTPSGLYNNSTAELSIIQLAPTNHYGHLDGVVSALRHKQLATVADYLYYNSNMELTPEALYQHVEQHLPSASHICNELKVPDNSSLQALVTSWRSITPFTHSSDLYNSLPLPHETTTNPPHYVAIQSFPTYSDTTELSAGDISEPTVGTIADLIQLLLAPPPASLKTLRETRPHVYVAPTPIITYAQGEYASHTEPRWHMHHSIFDQRTRTEKATYIAPHMKASQFYYCLLPAKNDCVLHSLTHHSIFCESPPLRDIASEHRPQYLRQIISMILIQNPSLATHIADITQGARRKTSEYIVRGTVTAADATNETLWMDEGDLIVLSSIFQCNIVFLNRDDAGDLHITTGIILDAQLHPTIPILNGFSHYNAVIPIDDQNLGAEMLIWIEQSTHHIYIPPHTASCICSAWTDIVTASAPVNTCRPTRSTANQINRYFPPTGHTNTTVATPSQWVSLTGHMGSMYTSRVMSSEPPRNPNLLPASKFNIRPHSDCLLIHAFASAYHVQSDNLQNASRDMHEHLLTVRGHGDIPTHDDLELLSACYQRNIIIFSNKVRTAARKLEPLRVLLHSYDSPFCLLLDCGGKYYGLRIMDHVLLQIITKDCSESIGQHIHPALLTFVEHATKCANQLPSQCAHTATTPTNPQRPNPSTSPLLLRTPPNATMLQLKTHIPAQSLSIDSYRTNNTEMLGLDLTDAVHTPHSTGITGVIQELWACHALNTHRITQQPLNQLLLDDTKYAVSRWEKWIESIFPTIETEAITSSPMEEIRVTLDLFTKTCSLRKQQKTKKNTPCQL